MSEKDFSDIGRVEAIESLFEGTGYKAFDDLRFESSNREYITSASKSFMEGVDFDLVYFPLKHLGYKCTVGVTGELYAHLARPMTLAVSLGISAKLDLSKIRVLWDGIVRAAVEHGYEKLSLELNPSPNGLTINMSATGVTSALSEKRRPAPKTKDLICVSGALGAAYLGLQVLEHQKSRFDKGELEDGNKQLEQYRMLVGAYLKPEIEPETISRLEASEIYPSCGFFITRGLADAVKSIVRSTGLGAKIYADKIPFEGNSFQLGRQMDIDPVSAAMNGGDDYKLLFTVPILELERFRRDFQTFDIVGHLAQSDAGACLVTPEGVEIPLNAPGWPDNESL